MKVLEEHLTLFLAESILSLVYSKVKLAAHWQPFPAAAGLFL